MNEIQKTEYQELKNLEGQGTLDDTQKARLELLSTVERAEKTAEDKSKELQSALAQKDHFRTKFEKEEADRKALENKLNADVPKGLKVEDYIDISSSLDGLDNREKEYLANLHRLSGAPLKDIRASEDFSLWRTAYQQKTEKEKLVLKPNSGQGEGDAPKSFTERLANASVTDKEKILAEAGLYKSPRPRMDKVDLGRGK